MWKPEVYTSQCLCHPGTMRSKVLPDRLAQSSDTWATIAANVSPFMALIGKRNSKESMRNTALWYQFLPLAAAALGILSILVSAIRLSGSGFFSWLVS
ncbi:hypothetical protein N7495_009627 [Penicillium taxi]|uniref:uncharacterized protein n=1 Tax=Penicillium taxi TaxID=168475 RepID=UPI0025459E9F|nr:uncharacterized protein N7495_009627 [Penicillium taxi]KAJ5885117.1 hypothetical protein N7495_009627 [Penicillium taxi]